MQIIASARFKPYIFSGDNKNITVTEKYLIDRKLGSKYCTRTKRCAKLTRCQITRVKDDCLIYDLTDNQLRFL